MEEVTGKGSAMDYADPKIPNDENKTILIQTARLHGKENRAMESAILSAAEKTKNCRITASGTFGCADTFWMTSLRKHRTC